MRVWRGASAVALAATLTAPAVAGARSGAYQPIQGAWSFEGGAVLIQPVSRHRFVGVVARKTTFGTCTHPRGQRMWKIAGSGRSYTGTHLYFKKSLPCAADRPGQATWTIRGTGRQQTVRFCSAEPGTGPPTASNPTTLCHILRRVAVPAAVSRSCSRLSSKVTLCLTGPAPLRTIGCLPRIRARATFTATLVGPGARTAGVRAGPFHLGRKRLKQRGQVVGEGRSVRFAIRAAAFSPGPHVLRAVTRTKRPQTSKKTVWVCD